MKPYYRDDASGITIYHGDGREVMASLQDKSVGIVLTDPPYGVGAIYGPAYHDDPTTYWQWFLPCVEEMRRVGNVVAFTHGTRSLHYVRDFDHVAVWRKTFSRTARLGNSPILPTWEPIFLFGIHTLGVKTTVAMDVFEYRPESTGTKGSLIGREAWQSLDPTRGVHPCPKPVSLYRALLAAFGQGGGLVFDPFMGSGTTLLAAKDFGREAIGVEIEERYCEIAAKRLAQGVLPFAVMAAD